MSDPTMTRTTQVWRFCVRLAVVFCLVAFGVGDAVERSLSGHMTFAEASTAAISNAQPYGLSGAHSGLHVDDDSGEVDAGGPMVGHGCHGCAALPERMLQGAAAPAVAGLTLAWTSTPSTMGRAPLVDLPPPRT